MSSPDDKGDVPAQSPGATQSAPEPTPLLKPSAPAWQTASAEAQPSQETTPPAPQEPQSAPAKIPETPETPHGNAQETVPETAATPPTSPTLDQARVFLSEDAVRLEPRPRKAAFLESKGFSTVQIDELLAEDDAKETAVGAPAEMTPATTATVPAPQTAAREVSSSSPLPPSSFDSSSGSSVPPIVTYPEFLSRPQRPPPLVTPDVFLNTLYGGAAAATLIYGTARFILGPMVDSLTDARVQLHDTTGTQLDKLLEKLEGVVSEVPPAAKAGHTAKAPVTALLEDDNDDDDISTSTDTTTESYDDPTEVFHRDVGVQTSIPPSPVLGPSADPDVKVIVTTEGGSNDNSNSAASAAPQPSAAEQHTAKLARMAEAIKGLTDSWLTAGNSPTSVHAEIQTAVTEVRDDVDKLARPPHYMYGAYSAGAYNSAASSNMAGGNNGKYPGYVLTTRNEPDDEIRKAKENIRRVKGALLTTRTFPTAR